MSFSCALALEKKCIVVAKERDKSVLWLQKWGVAALLIIVAVMALQSEADIETNII